MVALIPVEFDDALPEYAPGPQVGADPEWHEEGGSLGAGQRKDGVHVEVVIVVMTDHHGVDRGQPIQRDRRRV